MIEAYAVFLVFGLGFVLSVCVIGVLIPIAIRVDLVDAPSARKRHKGEVPLVGGLAIFASLAPLSLVLPFWQAQAGNWLILLGVPLLLVGIADDRWQISVRMRFAVEICCALVAARYCGIRIDDLGHLLPNVGGILVLLAIPLSVVGMVGVINAINMTDGVDGLAGGVAALTFATLAYLAYPVNHSVALQLVSLLAAIMGFLVFNSRFFGRKRAAVFLGDGGSIFIGFALAWYLIMLSQGDHAAIRPASALWLIAVPLLDTMTIMVRRIRHGRSPFSADREHFHHILLLAGFSAKQTTVIILSFHFLCILCGVASIGLKAPDWIIFWLFVGVFAIYFVGMNHAWKVQRFRA